MDMAHGKQELLDVLKFELDFLKAGGYRETPHVLGRSRFFFVDSPACLNLCLAPTERACPECALVQLTPSDRRSERFPCQHIRLDERGQTLKSLYSSRNQQETEAALANWLKAEIQELERTDVAPESRGKRRDV
jgi:hypothetical protein